ncbi:MAG: hypothetical protein R3F31_13630 [Verrucomicrobiales bacterium]
MRSFCNGSRPPGNPLSMQDSVSKFASEHPPLPIFPASRRGQRRLGRSEEAVFEIHGETRPHAVEDLPRHGIGGDGFVKTSEPLQHAAQLLLQEGLPGGVVALIRLTGPEHFDIAHRLLQGGQLLVPSVE